MSDPHVFQRDVCSVAGDRVSRDPRLLNFRPKTDSLGQETALPRGQNQGNTKGLQPLLALVCKGLQSLDSGHSLGQNLVLRVKEAQALKLGLEERDVL